MGSSGECPHSPLGPSHRPTRPQPPAQASPVLGAALDPGPRQGLDRTACAQEASLRPGRRDMNTQDIPHRVLASIREHKLCGSCCEETEGQQSRQPRVHRCEGGPAAGTQEETPERDMMPSGVGRGAGARWSASYVYPAPRGTAGPPHSACYRRRRGSSEQSSLPATPQQESELCLTQPAMPPAVVCAAQHQVGSAGQCGGRQRTSPPSWQSKRV